MEGKTVQVGKKAKIIYLQLQPFVTSKEEGLALEMSASETLNGYINNRQITLLYLAPTQHHSFLRNLAPLFICLKFTFSFGGVFFTDNTANCEGSIAMASPKIDF